MLLFLFVPLKREIDTQILKQYNGMVWFLIPLKIVRVYYLQIAIVYNINRKAAYQ